MSKQIAQMFNISDKSIIKQIQSQLEQAMTNVANTWNGSKFNLGDADWLDNAFDQLAQTITQNMNVIQSKLGIYDEFFNYFKNKKVYVSYMRKAGTRRMNTTKSLLNCRKSC